MKLTKQAAGHDDDAPQESVKGDARTLGVSPDRNPALRVGEESDPPGGTA